MLESTVKGIIMKKDLKPSKAKKLSPVRLAQVKAQKKLFLATQRGYLNVSTACSHCGLSPSTIANWRKKDTLFDKAVVEAINEAGDKLEEEARHRAFDGWEEPVIHAGQMQYKRDPITGGLALDENFDPIIITVLKKSDRLLEVMLQAKKPEYKRGGSFSIGTGGAGGTGEAIPKKITVEFIDSDGNGKPKSIAETQPEETSKSE